MFDNEDDIDDARGSGWRFVTNRIFQLPRNEKYIQLLEVRKDLIEKLKKQRLNK